MRRLIFVLATLAAWPAYAQCMTCNYGEAFDAPLPPMQGPTVLNEQANGDWLGVDPNGNPIVINRYHGGSGYVPPRNYVPRDTRRDCFAHAVIGLPCFN